MLKHALQSAQNHMGTMEAGIFYTNSDQNYSSSNACSASQIGYNHPGAIDFYGPWFSATSNSKLILKSEYLI